MSKLRTIEYYPSLREYVGSINAAIIVAYLESCFREQGKIFYKFMEPCNHRDYKEGTSWVEELHMTATEFRTALKHIAVVYKSKKEYNLSQDKFQGKMYLSYYDRISKLTYYMRNDDLVGRRFKEILEQEQAEQEKLQGKEQFDVEDGMEVQDRLEEMVDTMVLQAGVMEAEVIQQAHEPEEMVQLHGETRNEEVLVGIYNNINTKTNRSLINNISQKTNNKTNNKTDIKTIVSDWTPIDQEENINPNIGKRIDRNVNPNTSQRINENINLSTSQRINANIDANTSQKIDEKLIPVMNEANTVVKIIDAENTAREAIETVVLDHIAPVDRALETSITGSEISYQNTQSTEQNGNLEWAQGMQNPEEVPLEAIKQLFNQICQSHTPISAWSYWQQRKLRRLWVDYGQDLEAFKAVFEKVEASDFLSGRIKNWKAQLDWMLKPNHFSDILNDKYQNYHKAKKQSKGCCIEMLSHDWDFDEIERLEQRRIDQILAARGFALC